MHIILSSKLECVTNILLLHCVLPSIFQLVPLLPLVPSLIHSVPHHYSVIIQHLIEIYRTMN